MQRWSLGCPIPGGQHSSHSATHIGRSIAKTKAAAGSELCQAMERLQNAVKLISITYPVNVQEFNNSVETGNRQAIDQAFVELSRYKEELIDDLRTFIEIANENELDCHRAVELQQSLAGGLDAPEPYAFIHGAVCEIELLLAALRIGAPAAKKLNDTQQNYVLAGAVWLKFKQKETERCLAGKRTSKPTYEEAYPIAKQLGWQGNLQQFKDHAHQGTKAKPGLVGAGKDESRGN